MGLWGPMPLHFSQMQTRLPPGDTHASGLNHTVRSLLMGGGNHSSWVAKESLCQEFSWVKSDPEGWEAASVTRNSRYKGPDRGMSYHCTEGSHEGWQWSGEREGQENLAHVQPFKLLRAWFVGMMKNLNFILTAVNDTHKRNLLMITLGHGVKTQTAGGQEHRQEKSHSIELLSLTHLKYQF